LLLLKSTIIGEFSSVGNNPFWYDGYVYNGEVYSVNGERMDDLYQFTEAPQSINVTGIDPEGKQYCINGGINLDESTPLRYKVVECDDINPAYYLCYQTPVNCSELEPAVQGVRKKRQSYEDASLDAVFVHSKKVQMDLIAKRARATYSENFKKMNLQKSFGSLFEILW
jgi:hypothetical protein